MAGEILSVADQQSRRFRRQTWIDDAQDRRNLRAVENRRRTSSALNAGQLSLCETPPSKELTSRIMGEPTDPYCLLFFQPRLLSGGTLTRLLTSESGNTGQLEPALGLAAEIRMADRPPNPSEARLPPPDLLARDGRHSSRYCVWMMDLPPQACH
jgi:hypothetical protein